MEENEKLSLRDARVQSGFRTQEEIAQVLEMNVKQYSRYESVENPRLSRQTAARIVAALNRQRAQIRGQEKVSIYPLDLMSIRWTFGTQGKRREATDMERQVAFFQDSNYSVAVVLGASLARSLVSLEEKRQQFLYQMLKKLVLVVQQATGYSDVLDYLKQTSREAEWRSPFQIAEPSSLHNEGWKIVQHYHNQAGPLRNTVATIVLLVLEEWLMPRLLQFCRDQGIDGASGREESTQIVLGSLQTFVRSCIVEYEYQLADHLAACKVVLDDNE